MTIKGLGHLDLALDQAKKNMISIIIDSRMISHKDNSTMRVNRKM